MRSRRGALVFGSGESRDVSRGTLFQSQTPTEADRRSRLPPRLNTSGEECATQGELLACAPQAKLPHPLGSRALGSSLCVPHLGEDPTLALRQCPAIVNHNGFGLRASAPLERDQGGPPWSFLLHVYHM
jgi:hypothetical protein